MVSEQEVFLQTLKFLKVDRVTSELSNTMEFCFQQVKEKIIPRSITVKVQKKDWGSHPFYFEMESMDMRELLRDAETIVFLGGTLGVESERLLLETQIRNPMEGLVMDAILSSVVEVFLNEEQKELQEKIMPLYVTDRFSPGYGNFPIKFQENIGNILNISKNLGVYFNDSGIMIPRKSVLAVCGIQRKQPLYRHRGCDSCILKTHCELRKTGERCSIYGG